MSREKIGEITNFDEDESKATVKLTGEVSKGDKIAVLGPVAYESQELKSMQMNGEEKKKAGEGEEVEIEVETKVRESTSIYKLE